MVGEGRGDTFFHQRTKKHLFSDKKNEKWAEKEKKMKKSIKKMKKCLVFIK